MNFKTNKIKNCLAAGNYKIERFAHRNLCEKFLVNSIIFYQKAMSPMKISCCRFTPSCSTYAILAIGKYGISKGILKALLRILRCHPFSKGGLDLP